MTGLEKTTLTIGVFTSASRYFLLDYLADFKAIYPSLSIFLNQGDYTSIPQCIETEEVDFCFVNADLIETLENKPVYVNQLQVLVSPNHPFASQQWLSLQELSQVTLILLDEGHQNIARLAFESHQLTPKVEFTIYDDYTFVEMVKRELGIGLVYQSFLANIDVTDLVAIPITKGTHRQIALAWHKWDTLPLTAKRFLTYIIENVEK